MNDANHRPTNDVLDRATGALRDAPTPAGPPAELIAATVAAIDNRFAGVPPNELARQQRRSRTMRLLRYGSLTTAAALLLAGAAILFFGHGSAEAFSLRLVADKVKRAESVEFVQKQKIGEQAEMEMKVFMRGSLVRYEAGGGWTLIVADTKSKSGIILIPAAKAYEKLGKGGRGTVGSPNGKSPIELLLALQDRKPESTVEEKLDGKTIKKITIKDVKSDPPTDWIIFVDPKTELPVKMTSKTRAIAGDKVLPETNVYVNFVWNRKLDDKLFDMKPPAGYKEGMPGRRPDKK